MPIEGMAGVLLGLDGYVKGTQEGVAAAAQEIADMLETYAKENHPWIDQSGDTRASIHAVVAIPSETVVDVLLMAGMDYDVFLELAHGGKWAWLWPAVVANRQNILNILQRTLSGGGSYRAQQVTL